MCGKITKVCKVKNPKLVEYYLKMQQVQASFYKDGGAEEIKKIQAIADKNVEDFGL